MAAKALKRFILLAVLCLWATPAWAGITYTDIGGVSTITVSGAGYITNDFWDEARKQNWDVPQHISGTSMYAFIGPAKERIDWIIGDGVTATDVTSLQEQVYVSGKVEVQANATLTIGELHEGYGRRGSSWTFGGQGGSYRFADGGDVSIYASMLHQKGAAQQQYGDTDVIWRTVIYDGDRISSATNGPPYFIVTLDTLYLYDVYAANIFAFMLYESPIVTEGLHVHDSVWGIRSQYSPTIEDARSTDATTAEYNVMESTPDGNPTLLNPKSQFTLISIWGAGETLSVDWNVDVFVGDKDTEPESGVSAILYRNNLVTSGGSVFLCTTTHTGGDSGTTPVSGANWPDYWRVYFTGSDASGATEIQNVAGGDHRAGVSFYADDEVFNVLSGISGYIAQQQVTFKKWTTSSEYLDTWLHELTLQKTGFETLTQSIYINKQKDLWYEVLDPATVASDVLIEVGKGHVFRRLADPVIVPLQ